MLTRIPLKSVCEGSFVAIENTDTRWNNRDYKTLCVTIWGTARETKILNIVQVRSPSVKRQLAIAHMDSINLVSTSVVENLLDELTFGFGDVREGAPFLVVDHSSTGSPAQMAKWLKGNTQGAVLALEGKRRSKLSFDLMDDFILTKIRFS